MREYDPTWGVPSPAPQRETRQSGGYTDLQVNALLAAAVGTNVGIEATAAAEIAAGQWGRAFASAQVEPRTVATRALTPDVLALIGRELLLRGEAAFEIRIRRGELMLCPGCYWDVRGSVDPETWTYDLSAAGPDAVTTRRLSGDRVLHPRYAVAASRPWKGLSPLALQRETAQLAANLELRLRQEAGGQVGRLISLPNTDDTTAIETGLKAMNGRTMLVPSTTSGWGDGADAAPMRDWRPARLGADPPAPLVNLRADSVVHVLAASGVPSELVQRSDGTALREAWRQFLHATVQPVARLVTEELAHKLDTPGLRLNFDGLMASDLSGRARAFQSMVGGGMDVAKAAALAGLMEAE